MTKPSPTRSPTPPLSNHTFDINEVDTASLTAPHAFSPNSLTLRRGDSVLVTNKSTIAHTFTPAGLPDSGNMDPGATYRYRFMTTGRFDFICSYHSYMTGTITVTA